jgi:hypothetical protein
VRARITERLDLGDEVKVKVEWADVVGRRIGLVPV